MCTESCHYRIIDATTFDCVSMTANHVSGWLLLNAKRIIVERDGLQFLDYEYETKIEYYNEIIENFSNDQLEKARENLLASIKS